jgi:hypothetical protein
MASATFVMYCADDGTLGYLASCNRHDNADAYVYLMANDGYWDGGNALYLSRVPRAKMKSLNASDYSTTGAAMAHSTGVGLPPRRMPLR